MTKKELIAITTGFVLFMALWCTAIAHHDRSIIASYDHCVSISSDIRECTGND